MASTNLAQSTEQRYEALKSARKNVGEALDAFFRGEASPEQKLAINGALNSGRLDRLPKAERKAMLRQLVEELEALEEEKPQRDRMAESIATAQRRASTLVELRSQREDDAWQELIFISRYLVAMSLPYEATKERQITKSARLGDGRRAHLTLTAGLDGIDLPFGSDRTLLHWLLDQVARQIRESDGTKGLEQARFVKWSKASDYLKDMGLDAQGGKNYRDLRARYRRLSGLMIGIRVEGDGVGGTPTLAQAGANRLIRSGM
jgi:hypothetical protein